MSHMTYEFSTVYVHFIITQREVLWIQPHRLSKEIYVNYYVLGAIISIRIRGNVCRLLLTYPYDEVLKEDLVHGSVYFSRRN